MHQEITSRLVANYRKLLSTATKGRKQLEEHPDPQVRESQLALAGWLKEKEAYYQRRIEKLEGGTLAPPVRVMPLERPRPQPPAPKPPVRD